MCNYWQGYSSIWEEVTVSYCYKTEEQKKANGLTLLFSYPSATEWTQIMHWKKNSTFFTQLKAYYLQINDHSFCGSQKEY